jgi:O-antigen/teichoic acid export membrane protein
VLQDAYRFAFVATARPGRALETDLVWLVVQAAALGALAGTGQLSLSSVLLVWGGAATLALAVAWVRSQVAPDLLAARGWLQDQRDLWPRFTGELLALTGSWQLALLGLGLLAGLASVGALRAAQVLVGPLNVAFLAVPLVLVPESARWWRDGHGEPTRHAAWISSSLAALAMGWGLVVLAIPGSLGRALLGASWSTARELVVPLTLVMATVGITLGALTGLRVLGAARESLRARVTTAMAVVLGIVIGGALAGAPGAAWGWVAATTAGSCIWWRALQRAQRRAPAAALRLAVAS